MIIIKILLFVVTALTFESVMSAPSHLSRLPKSGSYSGYTSSAKFGSYTVSGNIKKTRVIFNLRAHGKETATLVGNLTKNSRRCFTGKISTSSSKIPVKLINCSYDVTNRKLFGLLESRGKKKTTLLLAGHKSIDADISTFPASSLVIANDSTIPISSGSVNYDAKYQDLTGASPNLTAESFPVTAKYDDLIISNIVSGAMLGHLIKTHDASKSVVLDRDRMYTSVLSHLLKEDGGQVAEQYAKDGMTIVSAADVMGAGQGGPYQINDWNNVLYDKGWLWDPNKGVSMRVDPVGLVSFTTLQGTMYPWTVDMQNTQSSPPFKGTPSYLNDKYFAPMVLA